MAQSRLGQWESGGVGEQDLAVLPMDCLKQGLTTVGEQKPLLEGCSAWPVAQPQAFGERPGAWPVAGSEAGQVHPTNAETVTGASAASAVYDGSACPTRRRSGLKPAGALFRPFLNPDWMGEIPRDRNWALGICDVRLVATEYLDAAPGRRPAVRILLPQAASKVKDEVRATVKVHDEAKVPRSLRLVRNNVELGMTTTFQTKQSSNRQNVHPAGPVEHGVTPSKTDGSSLCPPYSLALAKSKNEKTVTSCCAPCLNSCYLEKRMEPRLIAAKEKASQLGAARKV